MTDHREPERADAVALVRAHIRGDEPTVEAICRMVNIGIFPATLGLLVEMLVDALPGGFAELDEKLRDLQRDVL